MSKKCWPNGVSGQLRDGPLLGPEVWTSLRPEPASKQSTIEWPVASRRDGRQNRRPKKVALTCRRRRRRDPGYAGPEAAKYSCGLKIATETPQEPRCSSGDHNDGQARILPCRMRENPLQRSSPAGKDAGEHPGREFASRHSTARTKTAAVQVSGISPESARHPRRHLQYLQCPTTPDQPVHPSSLPGPGLHGVGRSHRGGVSTITAATHLDPSESN